MQTCQPLGAFPLLERLAILQRLQLALPDFSDQDQRTIGATEPFVLSQLQWPLTHLRRVVLNPDDVRALRTVDVLDADIAAQHGLADFSRRAAELAGARLVAVLIRFALF